MSDEETKEGVPAELASEIEAAADAAVQSREDGEVESQAEEVKPAPKEAPKAAPKAAEVEDPDDDDDDDEVEIGESALERAVRCGIPLSEAKQFSSEALLSAMCDRIEGGSGDSGGESAGGEGEKSSASVEDLLSAIPDLDPDEYDDKIVSGFKSLKELVKQQSEIIADLRGGQSKDWFSAKLEGVLPGADAVKSAAAREKFDVLKAGYKAAGRDVPDDAVFSEAAQLVLGDDLAAAKQDKKAKAAKRRSGQRISRASVKRVEQKGDPMAEVAAAVDNKFFS